VGIASAPDFTEDLMWGRASASERRVLEDAGRWEHPSAYGEDPYVITRRLIEEGRTHLLLRAPIGIGCPVHLLHGQRDPDVPWETSLRLAERLQSDAVTVELIKAGDHRLSTPADIERILAAAQRVVALVEERQREEPH
jgi:pimeloyl-ACP methyl ester carboxylesterase